MKLKTFFSLALSGLLALTACSKDDDPRAEEGSSVEIPSGERTFVLCQGCWGMNNASLSLFSPKHSSVIDNLYQKQNGVMLGDNAQDMAERNGEIFVAVNGSNCLVRLNAAGVEQARVEFATDPELQGGVRCIAVDGPTLYATFYGGIVARINATTLNVEAKLHTSGGNLEGITEAGGKLYVANSWSMVTDPATQSTSYVYHENILIIDTKTFTEDKVSVRVGANPNLLAYSRGKMFVISWGNYADKGNSFQVFTPGDVSATPITEAKDMAIGNGKVYLLRTFTDWSTSVTTNTFLSYDIASGRLSEDSFLKDAPAALASNNIYMMEVDPHTGDIYIGVAFYTEGNGDVYRFDRDGRFIEKFDAGGQNPFKAVFIK